MRKIILAVLVASIFVVSCGKKNDPTPLTANFEVQVTGEAPNAKISLVNKSISATSYEWTFGEGASINSSEDETPEGITVDKSGDFQVTLIAKSGSNQEQSTQTISITGNSAIVTYTDIALSQNLRDQTIGRFFSTSEGKVYLNSEVNATTGPLIDVAYHGFSTFNFFESPDNLLTNTIPGAVTTIPGTTNTKIKKFQSGFSVTDFDGMTGDQLLKDLTVESDGNTIGSLNFPLTVIFENSKGKKGVIKL
ncbi:MAG TPA: hypothetical protein DCS93_10505 [Microscillaceae bacterium]|nr:hypothetical protein [Microscillaceae bacterium]